MADDLNRVNETRQELQRLLRCLFQFDAADLEFGIYRILNQKRADIERFIERDLLQAVEEGVGLLAEEERGQAQAEMATLREELGADSFADDGSFLAEAWEEVRRSRFPRLREAAQNYQAAYERLHQSQIAHETQARIFDDLYTFFVRYYDEGDFLPKRRYGWRDSKFYVPYNGEEVLLHWANRDQYYVKSSEQFTSYRFALGGAVEQWALFQVVAADTPPNNEKGETRYFVLHAPEPVRYDEATQTLVVQWEYRPLRPDEAATLLEAANALGNSPYRKLDRERLNALWERRILAAIPVTAQSLRDTLAAPHRPGGDTSRLAYHLKQYTARHTMDYFIHKDLGTFLRRELDFYLKNEVLRLDDVIDDPQAEALRHALNRVRVVRHVAERIIAFLAQIEEFQKRLWEKKKFVIETHYMITLDRVPTAFYEEILANAAQLQQWNAVYAVTQWPHDLLWQGAWTEEALRHHPYLMLDTAFFDADFTWRLLATIENLDEATDGVLFHGDNFQALNLMQARYGEQVDYIYIDPPYNTGPSEILYKNDYKHSSWLSLINDRIQKAKLILTAKGVFTIAIDDNESLNLGVLVRQSLPEYEMTVVTVVHNPRGNITNNFAQTHEYAYFLTRRGSRSISRTLTPSDSPRPMRRWGEWSRREDRPTMFYPIYVRDSQIVHIGEIPADTFHPHRRDILKDDGSIEIWPIDGAGVERRWNFGLDKIGGELDRIIAVEEGGWDLYVAAERNVPKTVWADSEYDAGRHGRTLLAQMVGEHFPFPKSIYTVLRSVEMVCRELPTATILDFFAGSGTTAHAVMNLNREDSGSRKYILVEQGEYFDTVIRPRIQKVAFSSAWKEGVPQDRDGQSHMVRYQRLESYEDALNNIRVEEPEGEQRRLLYDEWGDYMLHYMLPHESRHSPTLLAPDQFTDPFRYTLRLQRGSTASEERPVDLIATFHYLIGMHVERMESYQHQGRPYRLTRGTVRTSAGTERVVTLWRSTEGLDLESEAAWAEATLGLDESLDHLYINGISLIPHAEPLEIRFREEMDGGRDAP